MTNTVSANTLASVAALIGDVARANILSALLGGKALTAGELAGVAGFFSNKSHKLDDADTAAMLKHVKADKLTAYGNTWETIANENLLHKLGDTSSFLKIELERVGKEMGDVHPVRGYGTHLAFDCSDGYLLQRWLWRNGIRLPNEEDPNNPYPKEDM